MGFFANVFLGCYVFYKNYKEKLNILFGATTFAISLWCLGDFLVFSSPIQQQAVFWDKLSTFGSLLAPTFLIHFSLIFTKFEAKVKRKVLLLYFPTLIFSSINFMTNLITISVEPSYWGYKIVGGILYIPHASLISTYVLLSIVLYCIFYFKAKSRREKKQAGFLAISFIVPLVGGIVTEAAAVPLKIEIFPLSSSLSTFTVFLIAYTMNKYSLMAITPAIVAENVINSMHDYMIITDTSNNIVFLNKSAREILGYEEKKIVGKPLDFILGEKCDVEPKELEKDGYLINRDMEIVAKDKNHIPVSTNISSIKDRSGETIGYVFLMRDVSSLKQLIKNLEEKTKELEESKKELQSRIEELERLSKLSVGRELKMIELKEKIKELKNKLK
ncbi:MAG: histidine kinase N-terminal 7TM domain-containing protein [Candidatus Aenigmatarchaeota archaeon]